MSALSTAFMQGWDEQIKQQYAGLGTEGRIYGVVDSASSNVWCVPPGTIFANGKGVTFGDVDDYAPILQEQINALHKQVIPTDEFTKLLDGFNGLLARFGG